MGKGTRTLRQATAERERWLRRQEQPKPTTKVQRACDRCTLGVMDGDNPHLHGLCGCDCHQPGAASRRDEGGR